MLTWTIVIGFSFIGFALYFFALLQSTKDDKKLLFNRLTQKKLENEQNENELMLMKEKNNSRKDYVRKLVQQSKNYREQSIQISNQIPELMAELEKWKAIELTEEEALDQYVQLKEERRHA